ncbi:hypothetical protein HanRHA438_Chr01g0000941 [Helianthus annuus]|nr:hypothetical protein HanRHA438_Chr01g0000941 [Helianthus annuus]
MNKYIYPFCCVCAPPHGEPIIIYTLETMRSININIMATYKHTYIYTHVLN